MQKRLSLGLTFGLAGNILFIAFALVCLFYYNIFDPTSGFVKFVEFLAYACLFSGFAFLVFSDMLLCSCLRMRVGFKIAYSVYIVMEAFLMYCELNSSLLSFYHPYSVALAISHAIASAIVCFTFVSLDPYKNQFEVVVIICIGVILGGMFGNLLGIRIYFSILVNAISFTALFALIKSLKKREIIEIDCYGDGARVAEYKGFFEGGDDEDDEPEKPEPAEKAAAPEKPAEPEKTVWEKPEPLPEPEPKPEKKPAEQVKPENGQKKSGQGQKNNSNKNRNNRGGKNAKNGKNSGSKKK